MTDREKIDKIAELFLLYIRTRKEYNSYDYDIEMELREIMNAEEPDNEIVD